MKTKSHAERIAAICAELERTGHDLGRIETVPAPRAEKVAALRQWLTAEAERFAVDLRGRGLGGLYGFPPQPERSDVFKLDVRGGIGGARIDCDG
jgi:hypothetical protein